MYKIKLICVGKLKEKYLIDMQDEYLKRLSKYCSFNITEVKDVNITENSSSKEEEIVKDKEAENVLKLLKPNDYVVLIDLHGKEYDSIEFSNNLKNTLDKNSEIVFIIAGSLGFSKKLYEVSKQRIKLSNLTFSHQMTRVILLEQIYRSFKIFNNETYHK